VVLLAVSLSTFLQQRRETTYSKIVRGLKDDFSVVLPGAQWRIFVNKDKSVTIRAELSTIRSRADMQELVVKIKQAISRRYPVKYIRLVGVDVQGVPGEMVRAVDFILER
jgi:hypothetical protein